jgi:hypothetical protein
LCSAYTAEMLFKTPRDMGYSLLDAWINGLLRDHAPIVFWLRWAAGFGLWPSHLAHSSAWG